jgi:hypothetical protein
MTSDTLSRRFSSPPVSFSDRMTSLGNFANQPLVAPSLLLLLLFAEKNEKRGILKTRQGCQIVYFRAKNPNLDNF